MPSVGGGGGERAINRAVRDVGAGDVVMRWGEVW